MKTKLMETTGFGDIFLHFLGEQQALCRHYSNKRAIKWWKPETDPGKCAHVKHFLVVQLRASYSELCYDVWTINRQLV